MHEDEPRVIAAAARRELFAVDTRDFVLRRVAVVVGYPINAGSLYKLARPKLFNGG
jgi:hypothetical protein